MTLEEAESIATIITEITTTLAIVVGGGWAIWKWGFSEKLRRKQEMSSPDGHLTATYTKLGNDRLVVSLEAIWRNRGPFPIELDAEHSYASAFTINESHATGSLGCDLLQVSKARLFSGRYIMEPNTDSVMHHQFVVPVGAVYLFRWIIALDSKHSREFGGDGTFVCSREIVVDGTTPVDEGA